MTCSPTIDAVLGLPNTRKIQSVIPPHDSKKNNNQLLGSRVAGMDPPAAGRCELTIKTLARRDRLRERHIELS